MKATAGLRSLLLSCCCQAALAAVVLLVEGCCVSPLNAHQTYVHAGWNLRVYALFDSRACVLLMLHTGCGATAEGAAPIHFTTAHRRQPHLRACVWA